MKCPSCNYEYETEYKQGKDIILKGDKEFIQIYSDLKFKVDNPKPWNHGDYDYEHKIDIDLVACPKCHTVLLDV